MPVDARFDNYYSEPSAQIPRSRSTCVDRENSGETEKDSTLNQVLESLWVFRFVGRFAEVTIRRLFRFGLGEIFSVKEGIPRPKSVACSSLVVVKPCVHRHKAHKAGGALSSRSLRATEVRREICMPNRLFISPHLGPLPCVPGRGRKTCNETSLRLPLPVFRERVGVRALLCAFRAASGSTSSR